MKITLSIYSLLCCSLASAKPASALLPFDVAIAPDIPCICSVWTKVRADEQSQNSAEKQTEHCIEGAGQELNLEYSLIATPPASTTELDLVSTEASDSAKLHNAYGFVLAMKFIQDAAEFKKIAGLPNNPIYMAEVLVNEKKQKEKIASRLLEKFIEKVKQSDFNGVFAHVDLYKTHALRMYEKYGFKVVFTNEQYGIVLDLSER
jgi:ribosomal protein S18 acetylase RimI-like enzyme